MRKFFWATLLVMMMSAATVLAAEWEQIYLDDNDNMIYFDTSSVNVVARNGDDAVFNASFRMDYSERGRNALIDWYRNNSIMPKDISSLSYDVATINFKKNGDKREYCIMTRKSYTADGRSLEDMHFVNSDPKWEAIPSGSLVEVEYYNALLIVEGKKFDANY